MRTFRVEGEICQPDPFQRETPADQSERYTHFLRIDKTEEGLGVFLQDCVIPAGQHMSRLFAKDPSLTTADVAAASLVSHSPLKLDRPSDQVLRSLRGRRYRGPCLVHVCPPRREGSQCYFRATTYDECIVGKGTVLEEVDDEALCQLYGTPGARVDRIYHPLEQATGVRILVLSEDGQEALLQMLPGASFRIQRDEHSTLQGESPALVVSWSGSELRVIRPARYCRGKWAKPATGSEKRVA